MLSAASLTASGKSLIGSYMGSSIPRRDIPAYIKLWRAGRLPVEKLLSGVRPLADINLAMDDLAVGRTVRQVLVP